VARNPAPVTAAGQWAGRQGSGAERKARDRERRTDVLDEVRVERAGFARAGNVSPPHGTGK